MAKRRLTIIGCLVLAFGVLVTAVILSRRNKIQSSRAEQSSPGAGAEPVPAPARALDPPPLPDSFERPGLASRRLGRMRVYLSVQPEVSLRDPNGRLLERIPILIVLENDTYEKQSWPPEKLNPGEFLFSLSVNRVPNQPKPAFTHNQPAGEQKPWEPAERRSFTIPWYARGVRVGEIYVVNLRVYGGGILELRSRIT